MNGILQKYFGKRRFDLTLPCLGQFPPSPTSRGLGEVISALIDLSL